jgi:hypothetical protein
LIFKSKVVGGRTSDEEETVDSGFVQESQDGPARVEFFRMSTSSLSFRARGRGMNKGAIGRVSNRCHGTHDQDLDVIRPVGSSFHSSRREADPRGRTGWSARGRRGRLTALGLGVRQKVWHSTRKGEDAGASELFIPRNQSIGSQRPRRAMTDDDGWDDREWFVRWRMQGWV